MECCFSGCVASCQALAEKWRWQYGPNQCAIVCIVVAPVGIECCSIWGKGRGLFCNVHIRQALLDQAKCPSSPASCFSGLRMEYFPSSKVFFLSGDVGP